MIHQLDFQAEDIWVNNDPTEFKFHSISLSNVMTPTLTSPTSTLIYVNSPLILVYEYCCSGICVQTSLSNVMTLGHIFWSSSILNFSMTCLPHDIFPISCWSVTKICSIIYYDHRSFSTCCCKESSKLL